MTSPDHSTYVEWLHADLDGELSSLERSQMERHLAGCESCRQERRELIEMESVLATSQIEVSDDFASSVMAALPAAGWQAKHPRTWAVALAVVALLGATSAALVGSSAARLDPAAPFIAASMAIFDLFTSSALAGAGLLSASWKGLGVGLEELLGGSNWNLVAFAVLVIGVNALLFKLLRKRDRPARSEAKTAGK